MGAWEQANEMCIDFHDNHFRAEEAFALKMLGCQQENWGANNHPFDVKDKQRKVQVGMIERNYKAISRVREHEGCLRTFASSIIHVHCVSVGYGICCALKGNIHRNVQNRSLSCRAN